MTSLQSGLRYIGCATSRAYMVLTTALVSSLEQYGDVADATLVVGDFGLTDEDREVLRACAGRMGRAMRFIAVEPDSPMIVARLGYDFPLPSLGRLVIPSQLTSPGARLVWLDSDMLINHSLQPLFDLDLAGKPMAAVRDPLSPNEQRARGRELDENYFNAGLLVLDLDRFNGKKLGQAAVRRLAEYPHAPTFLDQDGLNDVIGADWVRLERKWNLFYAGDPRQFTYEEYSDAPIVHFAGAKPTDAPDHPAYSLWAYQVERIAEKTAARRAMNASSPRLFGTMAHDLLLERDIAPSAFASRSPAEVLGDAIDDGAFRRNVIEPLAAGRPLAPRRTAVPTMAQRIWAAEHLPLAPESAAAVEKASDWRSFFAVLTADVHFMAVGGMAPIHVLPASTSGPVAAHDAPAATSRTAKPGLLERLGLR